MNRWRVSFLSAMIVLLIGGASLFFVIPVGGAMITGIPPVFDRLTAYVLCPQAEAYSYTDYGFGQPTISSPSGGTGHFTELTCTYPDGTLKTFPNEEVGLKGIAASFLAAGICSSLALLILVVLAAVIGWRLDKLK